MGQSGRDRPTWYCIILSRLRSSERWGMCPVSPVRTPSKLGDLRMTKSWTIRSWSRISSHMRSMIFRSSEITSMDWVRVYSSIMMVGGNRLIASTWRAWLLFAFLDSLSRFLSMGTYELTPWLNCRLSTPKAMLLSVTVSHIIFLDL